MFALVSQPGEAGLAGAAGGGHHWTTLQKRLWVGPWGRQSLKHSAQAGLGGAAGAAVLETFRQNGSAHLGPFHTRFIPVSYPFHTPFLSAPALGPPGFARISLVFACFFRMEFL